MNVVSSPAVQASITNLAQSLVPPGTIEAFAPPVQNGTVATLTIAIAYERPLNTSEKTNAEAAIKAQLLASLGITDPSKLTVTLVPRTTKRGQQAVSYDAVVTIAGDVPEPEPQEPTTESVFAAMNSPAVQSAIGQEIEDLIPSGSAAFGPPRIEGSVVHWTITTIYARSLADDEEDAHALAYRNFVAENVGVTDLSKVGIEFALLFQDKKRSVQSATYQALMTVSSASKMIGSVLLVLILVAFI